MRVIDSKINIVESFQYLIEAMKRAEEIKTTSYPMAYGVLTEALDYHVRKCTIPENVPVNNVDDLKDINI